MSKELPIKIGQAKVLEDLGQQYMTNKSSKKTRMAMLECYECLHPFRMAVGNMSHSGRCSTCASMASNKKISERFNIEIGTKFSSLEIIGTAESRKIGNTFRKMFKVKCKCGEKFDTPGTSLRTGKIKSCSACAWAERSEVVRIKTQAETVFTKRILNRAKKKNIEVTITAEEYIRKAKENCAYCGDKAKEANGTARIGENLLEINGLDRVDSSHGYTESNTVSCCRICNTMKASLSKEDFLKHIEKIHNNVVVTKQ